MQGTVVFVGGAWEGAFDAAGLGLDPDRPPTRVLLGLHERYVLRTPRNADGHPVYDLYLAMVHGPWPADVARLQAPTPEASPATVPSPAV